MTVDVERLTSAWLRARPTVAAEVDERVYTELPAEKTFPLVRLTLIDERAVHSRPLWLTSSLIQFDVYGGPKVQAREITDLIRGLLADEFTGDHSIGDTAGVVTGVKFGTMSYLPDTDLNPTRPRYRFDVEIFTHPTNDPPPS